MKTSVVKFTKSIVLGSACLAVLSGVAFAEEEKPTADLAVGVYSQYIWRGFELSQDSIVLQPSMTVGYKGFAFNLWGNFDTDHFSTETNEFTETDLTLSYDWGMGPVGFSAGYIYYAFDDTVTGSTDTQEFYLSASCDALLSPTLSVYRDSDSYPGWYVALGVSHSFPIKGDIALDLGAQVGYLDADEASSYAEVNNPTEAYSGFHNGLLSASVTIPVNEYISITPVLNYSFALSSKAEDLIESTSIDGNDSNFIYGGVSASFSF